MAKQLRLTPPVEHADVNGKGDYEVSLYFCYQRCIGQQSGGNRAELRCIGLAVVRPELTAGFML